VSSGIENPTTRFGKNFQISLDEILLWSIVVLSPLQDTALQYTPLKLLAASPAVLPLLVLALLSGWTCTFADSL
jgi:hypothetical protein